MARPLSSTAKMPHTDHRHAALLGAFLGDALSLGAHWIYNPSKIERVFGGITDLVDPREESARYHPGKSAGDFTHYGDQTLTLLRSLASRREFDLTGFAEDWRTMWPTYSGYVDSATQVALANLQAGAAPESSGSDSNDLAGASRIAPLLATLDINKPDALALAARQQTAMTHGDPEVIDAAEFFARATAAVLNGTPVPNAIRQAAQQPYANLPALEWIARAEALLDVDTTIAIQKLGQTCHAPNAFPATIYLLLKHPGDLETALIENTMAGGDSAARGLLVGMMLGAAHGDAALPAPWLEKLKARNEIESLYAALCGCGSASASTSASASAPQTEKVSFQNPDGESLDARLELPAGPPRAYAIFAHCFTCSKDIAAATRISRGLAARGIAVLRFDFTGLGNSEGDFANTNFSSNVQDLIAAGDHLRTHYQAPTLLVGHSLGGAAVLAASSHIPEIEGVVTIGAPADPAHVEHLFAHAAPEIEAAGLAEVDLAGRRFTIKKQFLDDIRSQNQTDRIAALKRSLLIMHSPVDTTVSVDDARRIFDAAKHPKSFISLDRADHLLSKKEDSEFAAEMIAAWASHLLDD
jgi:ADP-ribosylglycohydrolase/fermentation-respiration switch protein FrsA (DUF1100 family)